MANNYVMGPDGVSDAIVVSGVDATMSSGDPVQIGYLNGVALQDIDSDGEVVVDQAPKVYKHSVRNVTAYSTGDESTYGAIAVGDKIYYDDTDVNGALGLKLSTSPNNSGTAGSGEGAAANKLFGIAKSADATATAKTATIDVLTINPAV